MAMLALVLSGGFAADATACTATPTTTATLGTSYSPPAVRAGAVPALKAQAGLSCTPGLLILLGVNAVKAKFHSANGFKLKKTGGTATIDYAASADPAGTVAFAQDTTVDYMQNNLLNLLGLLGGSSADFPFYVKPSAAALPGVGTYTDRITINWDWYLCQGIGALFLCIGTLDEGSATTVIDVTLTVEAKQLTVATSSRTTWDPVNGVINPKALPGGRQRTTLLVANPDIVAIENNSMALTLPVAARQRIALDGDGSGSPAVFTYADGSPASSLAFAYASPGSTTDDVDFSNDGGTSWSYAPVAGSAASQGAVTHVRLRPRGSMAPGSNFSISLPFATR